MNETLEIELLSKIIYKPPCSPFADLCCSIAVFGEWLQFSGPESVVYLYYI